MTVDAIIREIWEAPYGGEILTRGTRVVQRPGWYQTISPTYKDASRNEVILSILDESEVDGVIDSTTQEYRQLGLSFQWCVGPYTKPSGMGRRLLRRGFHGWDVWGMACDPMTLRLPISSQVTVERVTLATVEEFVDASALGWNRLLDAKEREFCLEDYAWAIAQEDKFHFYLARHQGKPSGSAGYLLKPSGSAYLISASVVPEFRGGGTYRSLVAARLQELRTRGIRLATTQARRASSGPILKRFGFEIFFESQMYRLN